ncbi:QueT transporter family protein [Candidatus Hecatella orcuttiae]|jgi:uncharacterized membrane protein|uniref:QueT transporter family protein n=1 Tax=Candidatus Hecatella orcuttiae TaxID=1935119 RepID=UPI002867E9CF|nr:QueT transporter family protein [Candidatus Hecatella orcuttiae]
MESRDLTLAAIFGALYAVGVVALAPISFLPFQVRIADALLPLTMLFGYPAILGVTLGCVVANSFGGLGLVDMTLGPLANFLACSVGYRLGRKSKLAGSAAITAIVTLIVGAYLGVLFHLPLTVTWTGVLLGSIVAVNMVGLPLTYALDRRKAYLFRQPRRKG